jgi:hypothetical protein
MQMLKISGIRAYIAFTVALLGILLLGGISYGDSQSSTNYTIPNDVLSSGGETMDTTSYALASTLGQASAIGISSSGSYKNSAGFWPPVFSTAGGQAINFSLSVSIDPALAGSVTAPAINCPVDCNGAYNEGTEITLTASPTIGYQFDHWGGDVSSSDNPLLVSMNADMNITAVFIEAPGDEPTASTVGSTSVTENSAVLEGTVNPNGLDTTYYFEYGTTSCLGFSTEIILLTAGYNNVPVDYELDELSSNTTYYFRMVASNSQGTTYGDVLTFITQNQGVGLPPLKPELTSSLDEADDISLLPTFYTGLFSDPDSDDRHLQTEWQISETCDFISIVLETVSATNLYQLTAPHLNLLPNTTYHWRVRYYDNHLNHSDWSDAWAFTTQANTNDQNSNGIPDDLENQTVDLDNDGRPDIQQEDIKTINTVIGNCQIGVSIADEPNATAIEEIDSIDHKTISDIVRPYDMPLGLVAFRVLVKTPGDTINVTLYFCRAMPEEMTWYNYSSVDGWSDFSDYATFSPDRKSLTLELKDGGQGDADGVANGVIVDPSGSGIASFLEGLVFDVQTSDGIGYANIYIDEVFVKTFDDGHYLTMILPGNYPVITFAQGYDPRFDTFEIPEVFTINKDIGLTPVTGNTEPTVFITSPISDMTINAGETIVFRCTVTNGNDPLSYTWNFGGGVSNYEHEYPGRITFQNAGTFTVTLTANDVDGDTSSDTVTITVLGSSDNGGGGGGGGGGGCFINILRY